MWRLEREKFKEREWGKNPMADDTWCCPSLVEMKRKLAVMKCFLELQKDLGMGVALESFQRILAAVEADMFYDAVRCPDCQVCGNWEYFRCSR